MPVFNRELAGNKGRPTIVSVFKEFEQVSAIFITEHRQSPIVSNVPLVPSQQRSQRPRRSAARVVPAASRYARRGAKIAFEMPIHQMVLPTIQPLPRFLLTRGVVSERDKNCAIFIHIINSRG